MATKNLNVRISQKYDTFDQWTTNNPVLLAGELAVVNIPAGTTETGVTPPAVAIKVGDGTTAFNDLTYIQAVAGDVFAWAKAATKPSYAASEIADLKAFVEDNSLDTNTVYRLVTADDNPRKIILESTDILDTEGWAEVSHFTLPDAVTGIKIGTGNAIAKGPDGVITLPAYPTTLPASDVSDWAKAATKPVYTASEISDLADFISGEIEDTDTTYQLVADDTNPLKYNLQAKPKGGTWATVSSITLPDAILTISIGGTAVNKDASGNVDLPAYPDVKAWALAADKPEYDFSEIKNAPTMDDYAKKTDITAVLKYKGVKDTEADLPATDNAVGDVWVVTADHSEHVWNGTAWEKLGPQTDFSGFATKDEVTAVGKRIDDLTTTDVAEGDNLYYTEARATANFKTHASSELTDTAKIVYTDDTVVINCGNSTI